MSSGYNPDFNPTGIEGGVDTGGGLTALRCLHVQIQIHAEIRDGGIRGLELRRLQLHRV